MTRSVLFVLTGLLTVGVADARRQTASTRTISSSGPEVGRCGQAHLQVGRVPENRRLRIAEPIEFDDGVGIGGGRCYPLYDETRFLTWIETYHPVGQRLFVRRCLEIPGLVNVGAGVRSGAVSDDLDELKLAQVLQQVKFVKLDLPLWSTFANPSFCNRYLAYWGAALGADPAAQVFAIVFDLDAGRTAGREFVGTVEVESDSRDFFPPPRWSGHDRVTFDASLNGAVSIRHGTLRVVTLHVK